MLPREETAGVTPPASQSWTPKRAWVYLGVTLLLTVVVVLWLAMLGGRELIRSMSQGSLAGVLVSIAYECLVFGLVIYFAETRSFADFKTSFELTRPAAQAVLAGIGIGTMIPVVLNTLISSKHTGEWRLGANGFTFLALMAPFFEESIFRGFLYRCFRNRYPEAVAVCLCTILFICFHPQILRSSHALVAIPALGSILGFLRAKTGNLWPCVACHFTYNLIVNGWH